MAVSPYHTVIPAHAGIHGMKPTVLANSWIPACAGMTKQRGSAKGKPDGQPRR